MADHFVASSSRHGVRSPPRFSHQREETANTEDTELRSYVITYSDSRGNIIKTYQAGIAQYCESQQQSSGSTNIDPVEEGRAARDIWERAVGSQKSNRTVGSGGMGSSAFRTSIIPNLNDSPHSGSESTGRSYVPNAADLNNVTQLIQQLSDAHRELTERQAQHEQEVQALQEQARINEERMEEQNKINEERFKLLMDQMSQHSRPSSSHMPSYPPQQHFGGAFKLWTQYPKQYSHQQVQHRQQQPHQQLPHSQQQPYQQLQHSQQQSPQESFPNIDLNSYYDEQQ